MVVVEGQEGWLYVEGQEGWLQWKVRKDGCMQKARKYDCSGSFRRMGGIEGQEDGWSERLGMLDVVHGRFRIQEEWVQWKVRKDGYSKRLVRGMYPEMIA